MSAPLAVLGFRCGMWDLQLQHVEVFITWVGSSSLTTDRTRVPLHQACADLSYWTTGNLLTHSFIQQNIIQWSMSPSKEETLSSGVPGSGQGLGKPEESSRYQTNWYCFLNLSLKDQFAQSSVRLVFNQNLKV